ncbi:MAG: hypothetical protein SVZ03_04865 [Spirochaetota bacterium]|nr:hypothetical protein [Spirochaetota bacterium]
MLRINYQNKFFEKEAVELDNHSFTNCEFKDCMIILKTGDTEIKSCNFIDCKLILKENALTVGKIIKMFTKNGPLRVVDYDKNGIFHPSGGGDND